MNVLKLMHMSYKNSCQVGWLDGIYSQNDGYTEQKTSKHTSTWYRHYRLAI